VAGLNILGPCLRLAGIRIRAGNNNIKNQNVKSKIEEAFQADFYNRQVVPGLVDLEFTGRKTVFSKNFSE
jgi:hypothetical protein